MTAIAIALFTALAIIAVVAAFVAVIATCVNIGTDDTKPPWVRALAYGFVGLTITAIIASVIYPEARKFTDKRDRGAVEEVAK